MQHADSDVKVMLLHTLPSHNPMTVMLRLKGYGYEIVVCQVGARLGLEEVFVFDSKREQG